MTTNTPEPKPRRKWHFYKWLVLLIVATSAYAQWRAYTFNSAIKEAKALDWYIDYTDPYAEIRQDWKNAFKKNTWFDGVTWMLVPSGEELEEHRGLVQQLNPKNLSVGDCQSLRDLSALKGLTRLKSLEIGSASSLTNLDALQNLTSLERIGIFNADALTNVDELKNLSSVNSISLTDAKKLTNVDALKNLSALEHLELHYCTGLTNVDGLKNHKRLQEVRLENCSALTNVKGLKNLPALELVRLVECPGLTKESIEALKATLPNTKVDTGEPSPAPKPNELDTPPGARDTDR